MKRMLLTALALLLVASLAFAGGGKEEKSKAEGGADTVSVLAVWGGQELDAFRAMIQPFETETGTRIQYEGTRDIDAVLTTRIQAGNPPDVAGLPGPGRMIQFAREGQLVPLQNVLNMDELRKNYGESWIDLATVDQDLAGIFMKTSVKGLIWYNVGSVQQLGIQAGGGLPETWDEMMELSREIIAGGKAPWSVGLESGAASGWPGTDWLENIFLRMHGPQKYIDWYEGRLAWTSPEVRQVWQAWGDVVTDRQMVYGGPQYVLSTNFGQAAAPLFTDPPQAYFHQQASFIASFIKEQFPDLQAGEDFNFFGFPSIAPEHAKSVVGAGDLFGMFNDKEAAGKFMQFLVSTPPRRNG